MQITRQQSPESRELDTKCAALTALESDLAAKEHLATLHATLNAFEKKYLAIVGKRYAELDELRAQIVCPRTGICKWEF